MRRYLLIILSALALASCTLSGPEVALSEEGLVERTWAVEMNDVTRATLDDALRTVWEVGEHVSVYDHIAKVGRVFEVKYVEDDIATISGVITAGGEVPFDAIYPAGSAEWSDDGTATLKLPDIQQIPSGRNVCPGALVSTVHCESPDEVIAFHNVSSLLKVSLERGDITEINLELAGSSDEETSSYKVTAGDGSFAEGSYFIAVYPGMYAGGLTLVCTDASGAEYSKFFSSPLEAVAGGLNDLGTVADVAQRHYYNITDDTKVYASQQDLLDETGLLGSIDFVSTVLLNLFLANQFPDRNTPVSAISYTYLSVDPQGLPVELSALLYIPDAVLEGKKSLTGIAIANHGTIASNAECPTMKAQFTGAFAWKDYAVVVPDYYGFGASADRPQAYLDAETTARGNIDAYLAAVQLMADRGVSNPDNLLSFGYSQGGFNSMANLKYVTMHPELGVTFRKVICGGSPFDITGSWGGYYKVSSRSAIGFVPLALVSINEAQKLGIPYDHLFKGRLLDNWQKWILSKQYTIAEINRFLDTGDLSAILADELVSGTGPYFESIMATARRCTLTSGWTPPPGSTTKIIIYHSTEDEIVPVSNFKAMQAFLDKYIPNDYTAISAANGGHGNACIWFIVDTMNEW